MSKRSQSAAADPRAAATRHRFHIAEPPAGSDLVVRGDLAHRITRVLRLPAGARLQLFDGSGRSWTAEIVAVQRQTVQLAVGIAEPGDVEPPTVLLVGLMRPNRFEWLVEKATELGVTTIQPVISARSAVRPVEVGSARLERWRRIAVEAAEQCGRLTVPELHPPVALNDAIDPTLGQLFVAAEPAHGAAPSLGSRLRAIEGQPLTLLTGPEGGLTPEEVRAAAAVGGQPISLGTLILRAETAALAALAIVADARSARQQATVNGQQAPSTAAP